jgi:cobalt-zinc-cadmium efflux system outer membrane protein
MSARHAVTVLLGLALALPAGAAELGADLNGLLAYARAHNPDLRARGLQAEAAHAGVASASALPDPNLQVELMDFTNAEAGGPTTLAPGAVGATKYEIVQPLPFYGKRDLRGRVAASGAARSDAERDATRLDLDTRIKTAYARYYQAAGEARILTETKTLYDALEQVVFTRYGVGLVPQQDAIQAQSEITAARVDLIEAERKRRDAVATLNALLAREPDAPLAAPEGLPQPAAKPNLAALRTAAFDRSPDLARDRAAIDAARGTRDLALRDRYPDFALGLRDTRPKGGIQTWDVIVQMTIPLQQSARRSREAEAAYRLEAAQAEQDATRARILGQLGQALAAYQGSHDKAELLRGSLLPQARATLKAAQSGYETGQVDFTTLIQAERQILRTRLDLLDAEVDAAVRQAELEQLTGTPL